MWHALSLLREYRGDGHICALVGAGLSGIEALVTHTATGKGFVLSSPGPAAAGARRSGTGAVGGLAARGLLDADGDAHGGRGRAAGAGRGRDRRDGGGARGSIWATRAPRTSAASARR